MFKKIISFLLAATLLLSLLPMTSFAKTEDIMYGDANADGSVDFLDLLMLKRHIADQNPAGFNLVNADVNVDNVADNSDLLLLKKYLAEWTVLLGPDFFTVNFYDGDNLIDTMQCKNSSPLDSVPKTEHIAKADAIFVGWYTDPEFTTKFYADAPITKNTNVYAKYDALRGSDLTVTSYAQLDMGTDAAFTVVGTGDPSNILLTAKDGSDPVELSISGNGPYTVTAKDGFKKGASYELTLPEGLNYVGSSGETMPETIRTAAFTIEKEVVENIKVSDSVKYIRNAAPSAIKDGDTMDLAGVKTDDIICFYKITIPTERDYKSGNAYLDDPEVWFKAGSVSGEKVTLKNLDEEDNEKIYDIPDNFPVIGAIPTGDSGVLTLDYEDLDGYQLDIGMYQKTVEEGVTADLAYANQKISEGDFVSIYVSSEGLEEDGDIYFGKITAYDSVTGKITFIKSSAEEIETAVDLYIKPVLDGDDLISAEAKAQIEETVREQVQDSGFAEEAGSILADMVTKTSSFRNMDSVKVLFTDENGNPLSEEKIALLNIGKTFELSDSIQLTVEIVTSGDQIHFTDKGSVQLGIGLDAEFEIEVEDGKVVIDMSASFIQEVGIGVTANGSLVMSKFLGIPFPSGVKIGASVDILSYTAVNVDVTAYTVAEEEQNLWEQLKAAVQDPRKIADLLPDSGGFDKIKKGLNTVGDVFDKIDEVKEKIDQVKDDAEAVKGYTEDLTMLWDLVGELNLNDEISTKEKWEQLGQALGKTNVSKDLMDMLGLSTETGLESGRYAESLEDLLTKYSEMLERETDWVKLVQQEICQVEYNYKGLVVYFKADFVVRADLNVAMGTSIEYQVGKRYSFWIKIGLFVPQAGSSTMDLVDEEFAFQFYVMGKLCLKMGIEATVGLAIGSVDLARVGLHLELGPYVKLYGFFIYEYDKTREANTSEWKSSERMAGALYLDFGLYLIVGVDAAALADTFEVSYDFVDREFPLLEVGEEMYPYSFNYKPIDGESVRIQDSDRDMSTGITMRLPDEYRAVSYCNLKTGYLGATVYDWDNYNYIFSNPAFSIDENGVISVDVADGVQYIECDLTITYKYGKLAFSAFDMQVTIPLVWTNLSDVELTEYYTASVRVGNDLDGYDTVWSTRVLKNEEFTLPTEDEIKNLIGYNDYKYSTFSFSDAGITDTIISNTTYDCNVAYADYAVTVNGIQNTDGSTKTETFHTTYGEAFDFSTLSGTGTSKDGNAETAKYTAFAGVTTTSVVIVNGQAQTIDLNQPIIGKVADAIRSGTVSATANYVDDSVLITYTFSNISEPNYTERIRKGTESVYDFSSVVAGHGMAVKSVTPVLGKVSSTTIYHVDCGEIVGESYTLSFEENGGVAVTDITRVGGSIIGSLPTPVRAGYTFGGWYSDTDLTNKFTAKLMPIDGATVYAKWTANKYTVTLNVNGGNSLAAGKDSIAVTFDSTYGTLPVPTRDGQVFIGWFTEAIGGNEVTALTQVKKAGSHTIYAQWRILTDISASAFNFGEPDVYTYATRTTRQATYSFEAESGKIYKESDFTFKYKIQGEADYIDGLPIQGGNYDVLVTRAADDFYNKFEHLYTGVLTINYVSFDVNALWYKVQIREHCSKAGSTGKVDVKLTWSNTAQDKKDDLAINGSWNTVSFSRAGATPTIVNVDQPGNVSSKMTLEITCYDILNTEKTIYENTSGYIVTGYSREVSFAGLLPAVITTVPDIIVDSCSKAAINLHTYGVNADQLVGVEYIVDNPAVTIIGDKLIFDGSKLTSDTSTIIVKAKNKADNSIVVLTTLFVQGNIVD